MFAYLVTVFAGEELFVSRNGEAEWTLYHVPDGAGLHSILTGVSCGSLSLPSS